MKVEIKTPIEYTKLEIYDFQKDCTKAIRECPNGAASYEDVLSDSGEAILLGEISNEDVLEFYSYNKTLNIYGYDKYLDVTSKEMIKNYRLYNEHK